MTHWPPLSTETGSKSDPTSGSLRSAVQSLPRKVSFPVEPQSGSLNASLDGFESPVPKHDTVTTVQVTVVFRALAPWPLA